MMILERTTVRDRDVLRSHNANACMMFVVSSDDSWTRYLWIRRDEALKHYRRLRRNGYDSWDAYMEAVLPNWSVGYRGPGQSYSYEPSKMRRTAGGRKYILWVQEGGIDI